jgi:DHA1 family bicyclomycin/chloramphenicol resistance-like MFS transporter
MLAVLLGGLSMVSPFSIDTFFPAFHSMEAALGVNAWQLQQVITAYMVPFAFAALVHGPLSDALGRRPVMIWGMALYTAGSLACCFAPDYFSLLAFRAVQGITAGVGVVVGRAVVRDLYEGARAQKLMNASTMIFSIAPALAPIVGGWAHVAFGWRAIFALMVICGFVLAFSAWWKLPETHAPAARIPFSARNLAATTLTVLRHREFVALALAASVNFSSMAVLIGAAPAIVQIHWHLGETEYGQLFVPFVTGILIGAWFSGRIAGRMRLVGQVHLGYAITFLAAFLRLIMHFAFDEVPVVAQQVALFMSGLGVQIVFPVLTLRMLDLFPAARGTAASAQSFVALLMTAFTLGVVSPKVQHDMRAIAVASVIFSLGAMGVWTLSRRWHAQAEPAQPA